MTTIAVASGNAHKIKEIGEMLSLEDIALVSMKSLGFADDIIEDGAAFAENALIKAKAVCNALHVIAIADDSGLSVDALHGEPGIYSARYAADETHNATDDENVDKLLRNMKNVPEERRAAHFTSAMAVVFPDGRYAVVEGKCSGRILFERDGQGGFGYDPVFFSDELQKSFGSASSDEKNAVSHRRRAINLLKPQLISLLNVK